MHESLAQAKSWQYYIAYATSVPYVETSWTLQSLSFHVWLIHHLLDHLDGLILTMLQTACAALSWLRL